MTEILVLVDHVEGTVKKVTLELLTLARSLGEPSAVVAGRGAEAAVSTLAQYGAAKVYLAADAAYDDHVVAPKAELLAAVVAQAAPSAVLVPASAEGKEVGARLAIKIGSGIITDAIEVSPELVATQSVFGGSSVVHSRVSRGVPVIAVRPNSTPPVVGPAAGEVVPVAVELTAAARAARVVDRVVQEKGERPELTEASIIVSGGRGLGSGENFALIEKLADTIGAAVGASRAATDAGWYPHQHQVGQTGKTVSPQLYIATGISGAIQHRAGMQTSKTIVAINKDPEAPIFDLADFGVVGDLFDVVPQLTEKLAAHRS